MPRPRGSGSILVRFWLNLQINRVPAEGVENTAGGKTDKKRVVGMVGFANFEQSSEAQNWFDCGSILGIFPPMRLDIPRGIEWPLASALVRSCSS